MFQKPVMNHINELRCCTGWHFLRCDGHTLEITFSQSCTHLPRTPKVYSSTAENGPNNDTVFSCLSSIFDKPNLLSLLKLGYVFVILLLKMEPHRNQNYVWWHQLFGNTNSSVRRISWIKGKVTRWIVLKVSDNKSTSE